MIRYEEEYYHLLRSLVQLYKENFTSKFWFLRLTNFLYHEIDTFEKENNLPPLTIELSNDQLHKFLVEKGY